jgi:type III secretion protein D
MRLEPGKAVPLGPIVVAVDEPDAPWPTLEQLVLVPHAPALEPRLPPPAQPTPPRGRVVRARALLARHAVASTTVAATAGLSLVTVLAWPMGLHRVVPQRIAAAVLAPAAAQPHTAQRQAIEATLKELGLTERATIEPAGDGWLVRAPVLSDSESESLTAALSRMQPPPALRMTTEQDLRDAVADMLVRIAPEYRGSVTLRYLGEGRFRLEGRMPKAEERDKLLRSLASAFPQVREWDNAVLVNEEAAQRLLAELRERGWQVAGGWQQGTLEMQVALQQADVPQWERALLAAAQGHVVPFRVTLAIVQPPSARRVGETPLPFQIRSVVGGDMPYVLLPDGEKLAQGGTRQGWRLASISANQVVFENGARRATVQR